MANVHDVAAYILEKRGSMSAMKLQKLVYYSQAWHLVWSEDELFPERIEAWANGPVAPDLYQLHRGSFLVSPPWKGGNPAGLSQSERETVDIVLDYYGDRSAQWLVELTHSEAPWKDARKGCSPTERSSAPITPAAMVEYYAALAATA